MKKLVVLLSVSALFFSCARNYQPNVKQGVSYALWCKQMWSEGKRACTDWNDILLNEAKGILNYENPDGRNYLFTLEVKDKCHYKLNFYYHNPEVKYKKYVGSYIIDTCLPKQQVLNGKGWIPVYDPTKEIGYLKEQRKKKQK